MMKPNADSLFRLPSCSPPTDMLVATAAVRRRYVDELKHCMQRSLRARLVAIGDLGPQHPDSWLAGHTIAMALRWPTFAIATDNGPLLSILPLREALSGYAEWHWGRRDLECKPPIWTAAVILLAGGTSPYPCDQDDLECFRRWVTAQGYPPNPLDWPYTAFFNAHYDWGD